MDKILYKGTSDFEFVKSMIWRSLCIGLIIYLSFHYSENPPVIIIAMLICVVCFFFIGNDEITVYSDKIIQTDTSLARVFSKTKGKEYEIKEIKNASLPDQEKPGIPEAGLMAMLILFLPRQRHYSEQNLFYLDLKNGESVLIKSSLDQWKIAEIIKTINALV